MQSATPAAAAHRTQRARRRPMRRPAPRPATLVIHELGKGNAAVLSPAVFAEIFGHGDNGSSLDDASEDLTEARDAQVASNPDTQAWVEGLASEQGRATQSSSTTIDEKTRRCIAVAPWLPPSRDTIKTSTWTILPVRIDTTSTATSIAVPATALGLQSFGAALRASRGDVRTKSGFDVLVVPVEPLQLAEVFVKVDGEALRRHDEVQRKFGGGFVAGHKTLTVAKAKGRPVDSAADPAGADLYHRLSAAVNLALGQAGIVHVNDQIQIPLPAHPITHATFPPVELIIASPVDQGRVGPATRVIIDVENPKSAHRRQISTHYGPPKIDYLSQYIAEEDEDTTNDSFYSAAETGVPGESSEGDSLQTSDDQSSELEEIESSDDGGLSDDSGDELISLNSSMLPPTSGIMSSRTAATPRPFSHRQPSGMQSPRSVYSSYTVTTARPGGLGGRSFQLRPLYAKVADALLHPKPDGGEDDEARIFVDVKMLTRLGCFSGDWVKMSVTSASNMPYRSWSMNDFEADDVPEDFRVVKVYGIPDVPSNDAIQYAKTGSSRRLSQTSIAPLGRPMPNAYVSPVLFANLGQPASVTLAALSLTSHDGKRFFRSKLINSASPPIAKEVTLLRIPTPLSTERAVQPALLASLKQHFETRRRLIRTGDLVAIRFQPQVSRMLYDGADPTADADGGVIEEFLAATSGFASDAPSVEDTSVAWFRIGNLTNANVDPDDPLMDRDLWGGMATVEPLVTKMVQVGRAPGRIPAVVDNPWPFYFDMKTIPRTILSTPTSIPTPATASSQYVRPAQKQIREILAAATSQQAKRLGLAPSVILLHSTQRRIGKLHLTATACADLGLHVFPIDAYDILSEGATGGDVKTEATLRARVERGLDCGADSVVPLIQHTEALTADRIASTLQDMLEDLRALVMTTTEIDKVPDNVRSLVTHEVQVSAPGEAERECILRDIVQELGLTLALDLDLNSIALKTAALVAGDLLDVVERSSIARQTRLEDLSELQGGIAISDILVAGGVQARCLTKADFETAVEATRKNFADSIGAPKIPNVRWADVGGLAHAQAALRETIQLPLERPELFARGARKRSGVLLYGPPGTGKTLLAKAVATEFSLNFFSVKGPELLNMYIGESEANVRRVFARARDARPCVVFFDELDAIAPRRGNQGDSGGVMDRIVSQLLAELDGMSGGSGSDSGGGGGVFVIGATNRPDLLDPALLRPGRFDKMLYLGVPDSHAAQRTVLEALTRNFTLDDTLSLARVADTLPFTYTGADMYALCADAMLKAIMRRAADVDRKIEMLEQQQGKQPGDITPAWFFDHVAEEEDTRVCVTEEDFGQARSELVASVRYVIWGYECMLQVASRPTVMCCEKTRS